MIGENGTGMDKRRKEYSLRRILTVKADPAKRKDLKIIRLMYYN